METLLTDEWLPDADAISTRDDASLSLVRDRIRELASAHELDADVAARAALVATELGRNQLRHAYQGRVAVRLAERDAHRGVEIVAADRGDGVVDPTRAFDGKPRVHGSLGVGLVAVSENATEVDYDVRLREGTCVWARVFPRDAPRRRQVGVYGRAIAGEPVSGDHAGFRRDGGILVAGVCDGLGHGTPAREASSTAMATFHAQRATSPVDLLQACHDVLGPTRGAVMAVARIDDSDRAFETASVGNIAVQLVCPRLVRRFGGSSAVLGSRTGAARPRAERTTLRGDEMLLMTSDGISSRASIEADLDLLREHPIVIAHQVVTRFGRDNDDVLVLVVK